MSVTLCSRNCTENAQSPPKLFYFTTGIFTITGYILNFEKGYLSDQKIQSGKIIKPAVYSSDNKYTEHWKDGVLHCENGPAVINGFKHYEEWWINGKQIEPRK